MIRARFYATISRCCSSTIIHQCFIKNCWRLTTSVSYVTLPDMVSPHPIAAVCQLTSTADKEENLLTCKALIKRSKSKGAAIVFLPECFDYVGENREQSLSMAESLDGELIREYRDLAKEQEIWLSLGGFHHKGPLSDRDRVLNMHVVIDSAGEITATYSKVHLFDVDIPGQVKLQESSYTIPGPEVVAPLDTPVGRMGMSIDLRFPEMSMALTQQGAQILTFPSAFTQITGLAHWESLLRSRAIENQCYVIAAAQTGKHNEKRTSYGHSMIVDPWGCIVSQCHEGIDVCTAEIDLNYLTSVRANMPVWSHRRPDLYGVIQTRTKKAIDCQSYYQFGDYQIQSTQLFFRSSLTIGFVNIKPVLPGHVLIATIRPAEKFSDLSPAEVTDLFLAVQKISSVVQKHFKGTSITVAIQDGPDAGQTVNHVHVHILPRQPGDIPGNDDVYNQLQKHDAELYKEGTLRRSEEEMAAEASALRTYFTDSIF